MDYQAVIGLEVHAQMLTDSKIFCGCSTKFGAEPNSSICPVCTAQPGVLPVLNKRVVEFGIRTALATNGEVCDGSWFARKNYFYPDLPKGYQISQYEHPLAKGGYIEIEADGAKKKIGLIRIHMEEDAGKLLHDERAPQSYVDLNRTGVPLLEIVSEPDISTPQEAGAYLKKLRSILRYLEVCDGNMEEGSFRCDANVSVRPVGAHQLGTRTELKNMNSFRNVEKALEYEIRRQIQVIEGGGAVVQETRLWNDARDMTESMRSKEEAHDYRYFPDPDLVALMIDGTWIEQVKRGLPELPDHKVDRFVRDYGIPSYDAQVLCAEKEMADYFEAVVARNAPPKQASNWIMTELMRELKENRRDITDSPVSAANLAGLVSLIDAGTISGKIAKAVFTEMAKTGKSADEIVKAQGLTQISDPAQIEEVIRRVVGAFPKEAADFKAGKEKLLTFFVGQVMKETRGKANPQMVNDLLNKVLSGS